MSRITSKRGPGLYRRCAIEVLEGRVLLTAGPPNIVDIEVASTAWSAEFLSFVRNQDESSIGYSIPTGRNQLRTLTWSNIDQIIIRFSEDVHVDSADLSLSGINTIAKEFSDFHYDPMDYVATWTLTSPLDKDRLQIDIDANGLDPICDVDFNILDGEWDNKRSQISGDGIAGGDFEFWLNVLPADANYSGEVTSPDHASIYALNGKSISDEGYAANCDVDGSGVIDSSDWQEAIDRYMEQLPYGAPAGKYNDAPTTSGLSLVQINDDAQDVAISLSSAFGDTENGGSGLTYSIVSNTSGSLFDTATINQATKHLILNAASANSARASIVVRATDAAGLFTDATLTVDIFRENQAPVIHDFSIRNVGVDTWLVSGYVTDSDDDISDFIVKFYGEFSIRSAVEEDGSFMFAVILDEDQFGTEYAVTSDLNGLESEIDFHPVGF